VRLSFTAPRSERERVLAALIELAPHGFEELDRGDSVEFALYGAPGELPELGGANEAELAGVRVSVRSRPVPVDWADRWRRFHRPVTVAGVHVRPPWCSAPKGVRADIVIDPGRAFGTGAHASTRLAIELLVALADERPELRGAPLWDLGCGSGVLALVASALGFTVVSACDWDEAAVAATRANARANALALAAVERRDVLRDELPPAALYMANLTGPVLRQLATRVADDAWVVASGFIASEEQAIVAAFARHRPVAQRREEEWRACLFAPARS